MDEVLQLLDCVPEKGHPDHPDHLVLFFHESATSHRWEIAAIARLKGWGRFSFTEQTTLYHHPLVETLENIRDRERATKVGFVNFREAVGITNGSLNTDIAHAIRSSTLGTSKFYDIVFLEDGNNAVIETPIPSITNT